MGTEYVCKRCGFFAKIRKNYEIHLEKKNMCKPKISNIDRSLLVEELKVYIQSASKGGIVLKNTLKSAEAALESAGGNTKLFLCGNCSKEFKEHRYLTQHTQRKNKCSIKNKIKDDEIENLKEEIKALKNEKKKKLPMFPQSTTTTET